MRGRQVTFRWLPQSRFALPLQMLLMALVVGAIWATHRSAPNDRSWMGYTYVLLFPSWIIGLMGPRLRFLADGALVTLPTLGAPRHIPLGTAELNCQGAFWELRWQRGRTWTRTRLRADAALPLEAAIGVAKARAAEGLPVPRTEREAARAVPVGRLEGPEISPLHSIVAVCTLALAVLAVWQNQPLFLVPAIFTPLLFRRDQADPCAVLTRSGLWITAPGGIPAWVDPASVTYTAETPNGISVFRTGHPEYPELRLKTYQNTDLIRILRYGTAPSPLERGAGSGA